MDSRPKPIRKGRSRIVRTAMERMMENITYVVEGDKLVITIPDLKAKGKPSSTGKTMLIASSQGAVPIEHKRSGIKFALNVTVPA